MFFGNLYKKKHVLQTRHDDFSKKQVFCKKNTAFMVEKAKQKLLLENCGGGLPSATSLASYQQILTIYLIKGDHSLFAMQDEFEY